ncbi:hypothetical protein UFOVP81_14 [uncultured Caudovirales phage]|uniref:Uncharacterized protein n=1 Tax=uncultured Caudovirales phage TaxID=2100421 RepID=A0A6J5L3Q8_9CAUD|nr:hypothetical protein UFOVP81_14 [uncultured Caudovirales phage]
MNEQNKQNAHLVIHNTVQKQTSYGDLFETVIEEKGKNGITYYIGYSSKICGPARREDGNDKYIYLPLGEIKDLVNLIWDYLIESGERYVKFYKNKDEEKQEETDSNTITISKNEVIGILEQSL